MCYNKPMNKQLSMSFVQDELAEVKTNKTAFLAQMNRLVPWSEWVKKIESYYDKGKRGNKPRDLVPTLPDKRTAGSVYESPLRLS